MRLRPFFKRYGSKHRLAPKYPKPIYDILTETYAGSAQIATLYYNKQVVLAEYDSDLYQLWDWLINVATPNDIKSLPFDLIPGTDIRTLDIHYGAKVLIRQWQRVGRCGCWTVSKWNNANSGFWSKSTRDAIAAQVSQIKHWHLLSSAEELFEMFRDIPCTHFIDPPYQLQANVYGTPPIDYKKLGDICRTLKGQVIVCEQPGADWLPFEPLAENTVGRTKQGGTRARRTEMIWHFINTSNLAVETAPERKVVLSA